MLSEMEYRDNAKWKIFWTQLHPEEFGTDCVYVCDVTDEDRTPDELAEFEAWLVRCGYSEDTAKRAAEALRKLHADD